MYGLAPQPRWARSLRRIATRGLVVDLDRQQVRAAHVDLFEDQTADLATLTQALSSRASCRR